MTFKDNFSTEKHSELGYSIIYLAIVTTTFDTRNIITFWDNQQYSIKQIFIGQVYTASNSNCYPSKPFDKVSSYIHMEE